VSRENVSAKGRRYLAEGRLVITRVEGRSIRAGCRGDGAVYLLGHGARGWFCDCPARGRCAHLVALGLVTALPREE
jgi:uncharacterized Zn finger protein